MDELQKRNVITDDEWWLIADHKIQVGMSELALLASWGSPGLYGAINRTATSAGVQIQWVYRNCQGCRTRYVYTQDGKVVSWQD
jgi:hypothetical protein